MLSGISHSTFVFYYLGQVKLIFVDSGLNLGDGRTLPGQLYELAMSLKNYPIATMLISLWAIIVEIVRLSNRNEDSTTHQYWIYLLLAILQSSQGVFHVIIYFYRSYRRGTIWSSDEGLCGLCCQLGAIEAEMKTDPNSPLMLSITANDHEFRVNSTSDVSASVPSMLDVERAVDALCPLFDGANENSYFGNGNSHGAASDTPFGPPTVASTQSTQTTGTTETTFSPQLQTSVSVRIGHDSENSETSSNPGSLRIDKHSGKDIHSSFGICFED